MKSFRAAKEAARVNSPHPHQCTECRVKYTHVQPGCAKPYNWPCPTAECLLKYMERREVRVVGNRPSFANVIIKHSSRYDTGSGPEDPWPLKKE